MQGHLNLIKSDFQDVEKRVLPRFPYTYLTFKCQGNREHQVFEVKDISYTGMQLCLKDGTVAQKEGEAIEGELHWKGQRLAVSGLVKWAKGARIGVQFGTRVTGGKALMSFLSLENLVKGLRPIHDTPLDLEVPLNLRYWLSGDGPVEVYVWQYGHHVVARLQIILLHNFIEWVDGEGPRTGRVMTLRNLDSPLVHEGEYIFQLDAAPDQAKLGLAQELLRLIPSAYLPTETITFMQYKLRI